MSFPNKATWLKIDSSCMVTLGYCASQYLLCELCKPFSSLQIGTKDHFYSLHEKHQPALIRQVWQWRAKPLSGALVTAVKHTRLAFCRMKPFVFLQVFGHCVGKQLVASIGTRWNLWKCLNESLLNEMSKFRKTCTLTDILLKKKIWPGILKKNNKRKKELFFIWKCKINILKL